MDQSDLELLQIVPFYHLQAVIKTRQISFSSLHLQEGGLTGSGLAPAYSVNALQDLAQHLFAPAALQAVLATLDPLPARILRELVNCGGRANSRDLALYLSAANDLDGAPSAPGDLPAASNVSLPSLNAVSTTRLTLKFPPQPPQPPHYPAAHPHGPFEQSVRHLLMLGLIFWGKQTNFAGRDYTSGVHDGVLVVPQPVRTAARDYWQIDAHSGTFSSPAVEKGVQESVDASSQSDPLIRACVFQRILYFYWAQVASQRNGLPLQANGLLTRSVLRQIIEALGEQHIDGDQSDSDHFHIPRPDQPGYVGMEHKNSAASHSTNLEAASPHPRKLISNLPPLEQVKSELDAPYMYFIRLLLQKIGLLQVHNLSVRAIPVAADTFFALPIVERIYRCYQLYRDTTFWNEILFIPEITVRPGPTPLEPAHSEVVQARQAVIDRLRYETVSVWHPVVAFIARTKLYVPYLLFPRQYGPRVERYSGGSNPYGWDFRLRRGWLTHREGWHMVEGGFIRAMIGGPLSWLGLLELDRQEYPVQFRLSAGAPFLFDEHYQDLQAHEAEPGRLIIQPNFEIMILAPVSEALLILLDRFAERISLDLVARYRISRNSITRALQSGLQGEAILRKLEQMAGHELPQNVRYSLLEWERQARRIEIWPHMTLLEVDDPSLLDAILADEQKRLLFGRRFSPQLVEVVSSQLAAVQDLFWQRNELPAHTVVGSLTNGSEPGKQYTSTSSSEPQWRLLENGLLEPLYAVSDLYQTREAQRFCVVDPQTSWYCITAAGVRHALAEGLELADILRFLQRACIDAIPGSFLIRLKLWGGGYQAPDDIVIEQAPLLRLPNDIFQDIPADEELRALLGSEIEPAYRLLRIDPAHLERLQALLRERGFRL